jgi:phosphoglycolate phosphatase-like HAD superfamily hydrolase
VNPLLQPSLVMLDCDGTMFDSYEANRAFYDAVLEQLELPPLDAEGRELAHRLSSPQLFAHLFRDDPETLERAGAIARSTDYTPFLFRMTPMPELFETLVWLHERYRTALVTNRGSTIPRLLEHFDLGQHFDFVVGIHDVAKPKPAPDMILRCLEHFAVPPGNAVYVGDSPGDLEASRAAGVPFIAVGGLAGGGDRHLESFAELIRVLG